MIRRLALVGLVASSALILSAAPAHAQASLAKAKELYASANYEEALSMLNALGSGGPSGEGATAVPPEETAAVAMYRVLCLVAIGRTGEVDAAIDRLVSQHPLYRPPSDELSPRMRTAFNAARMKLLPALVQQRYADGKAAYDRGDFATASVGFKWVLGALADPDIAYLATQSPLADIRTLATGFSALSEKALAPPPPPPAPVAITPPPVTVPERDLTRVFSLDDSDVVAPVAVRQSLPRFPGAITAAAAGVLEIVVDAKGAVESARMIESVHAQYDNLVVSAAKKWQYQPARLGGTPVKYMKRIQVSLTPTPGQSSPTGRR